MTELGGRVPRRMGVTLAGVVTAVALLLGNASWARADWNQPAAGSLNVDAAGDVQPPHIASVSGTPYVIWPELNHNALYVRRLTSTGWSRVGGLVSDGLHNAPRASITALNGAPYVAYQEWNEPGHINQIHVRTFNGSAWVDVGASSLNMSTTHQAGSPSIANIGGTLYVAWVEANGSGIYQLYVDRYTGSSWVQAGVGPLNVNPASWADLPSLTGIGGTPYVAWDEYASDLPPGQIYVKRFDGTSWNEVGAAPINHNASADAYAPTLADVGGMPWLSWSEAPSTGPSTFGAYQAEVADFTAGNWVSVGPSANIDPAHSGLGQIGSFGGHLLLGLEQYTPAGYSQLWVRRFTGSTWATVGSRLSLGAADFFYGGTAADVGGVPYVAWAEGATNNTTQVYVKRLEPAIGTETATPSTTGATLSAQISDYGVPLPLAFEYGTTAAFGQSTPRQMTPGTGNGTVTSALSGLTPTTTYFFRAFGTDTFRQTSLGATQQFMTVKVTSAPKCSLSVIKGSVALSRPKHKSKHKHKHKLRPLGTVTLKARCDQAVSASLAGTVKGKSKSRHNGHATHKTKRFKVKVAARHEALGAGAALKITVKLPKKALSKLKSGARESVTFVLTASDLNGTTTATAKIGRLKVSKSG